MKEFRFNTDDYVEAFYIDENGRYGIELSDSEYAEVLAALDKYERVQSFLDARLRGARDNTIGGED